MSNLEIIYAGVTHVKQTDLIRVVKKIRGILAAQPLDTELLAVGMHRLGQERCHINRAQVDPVNEFAPPAYITGTAELDELDMELYINPPKDDPQGAIRIIDAYIRKFG